MKLIVLHYHFRPGGVRRVIELATPFLGTTLVPKITEVMLASGEKIDAAWLGSFSRSLGELPVTEFVAPCFGYVSEMKEQTKVLLEKLDGEVQRLLAGSEALVWFHNPGVGRNLPLAQCVQRAGTVHSLSLVMHQHDWWFDNRWSRWPEFEATGFSTLAATASALLSGNRSVHQVAINQSDTAILRRHLGNRAAWLPNLLASHVPPAEDAVENARQWLQQRTGGSDHPVWILPCRLLRRKNVAEALLLTRWLRAGAWLVTTGGVSSADEQAYARKLNAAAAEHRWPLRLSVLAGDESKMPKVNELVAASEAVVLTSIQEGFGLPYLEAAEAYRPLLARRLPNVAPDLRQFGLTFPQSYDELLVDGSLFDFHAERERQHALFERWKLAMPAAVQPFANEPEWLACAGAVPFSRLTLTAQLEVLAKPLSQSWSRCAPLNPFLAGWREAAESARLQPTSGLEQARTQLSGAAYAARFCEILATENRTSSDDAIALQDEFIRARLAPENLYPLLWSAES